MILEELDKEWEGQNVEKAALKALCRKYSPKAIMEWVHRGLSIESKELLITWHRESLNQLGAPIIDIPESSPENDYGDYFSER